MNRIILLLLFGWLLLVGLSCRDNQKNAWKSDEKAKVNEQVQVSDDNPVPSGTVGKVAVKVKKKKGEEIVPDYALETLDYIKLHDKAPKGYVGGRTFQNRERRLPDENAAGERITYREWDVNLKERGKNRGAERLITGSDNSAYYTKNHYKTFLKVEKSAQNEGQQQ